MLGCVRDLSVALIPREGAYAVEYGLAVVRLEDERINKCISGISNRHIVILWVVGKLREVVVALTFAQKVRESRIDSAATLQRCRWNRISFLWSAARTRYDGK